MRRKTGSSGQKIGRCRFGITSLSNWKSPKPAAARSLVFVAAVDCSAALRSSSFSGVDYGHGDVGPDFHCNAGIRRGIGRDVVQAMVGGRGDPRWITASISSPGYRGPGSTLLAAILLQNPRIHAGISSPLASLVMALQRQMSQENEAATFIDDGQRATILRGVVDGYYARLHPTRLVLDTNRAWCAKLPLVATLFPGARIIACVRDVRWIMDSIERLIRRNTLELSRIFNFDAGGTVYSRAETLAGGSGLVGFALNAVREAVFGEQADRVMLLTYETLTAEPERALAAVYAFLGEPAFAHDFDDIRFDAAEFDQRLGTPGLHRVARRVEAVERVSVLPPDLFMRFGADAFWHDPAVGQRGVRVV